MASSAKGWVFLDKEAVNDRVLPLALPAAVNSSVPDKAALSVKPDKV